MDPTLASQAPDGDPEASGAVRWTISDAVAWVDTEPDAIAVVRVDDPVARPALIPEPYAHLWRAIDTSCGADQATLVRVVQELGGADAVPIVGEFLDRLVSLGLLTEHLATQT